MKRLNSSKSPSLTQVTCRLDEETYKTLQDLAQSRNLEDLGEAIRLLVDFHQIAYQTVQAIRSDEG